MTRSRHTPPDLRDPTPPTPADAREAELADLDAQRAGRVALRTATTIRTGRYL